jgi:hypothetical protein
MLGGCLRCQQLYYSKYEPIKENLNLLMIYFELKVKRQCKAGIKSKKEHSSDFISKHDHVSLTFFFLQNKYLIVLKKFSSVATYILTSYHSFVM